MDKDNDPSTGKIILKDHPYGCPPYTINVKGMTTGYDATRPNRNPAQFESLISNRRAWFKFGLAGFEISSYLINQDKSY